MRGRVVVAASVALIAAALGAVAWAAPVRTSTSGWSWASPRPQGHGLHAIEFAGARGYAAGEFGTLLRTDDGGTSWSGIRTGAPVALSELSVIDSDSFVAAGPCSLFRSDDGGRTVRRRDLPGPRRCTSPVAGLDFPTPNVGYVVRADRTVLRTTDGGATFAARAALPAGGGPANAVEFTSANVGVAVTGLPPMGVPPEGRIFRTIDGGASWTQVFSGRSVHAVFFVSPTTGYAVGAKLLLRTDDGGATWTPKPTSDRTRFLGVNCADVLHCVATTLGSGVVHTEDGFATHATSTRNEVSEFAVPGDEAAFATATRVVSVANAGHMWNSDDGGKTFDRGYIRPFRANSLAAGPGKVGYAFGSAGRLSRTTDGGQTWQGRTAIPTSRAINGWWVPDLLGVVAIDSSGFLFRSDDGGATWAELGEASPDDPRGLWSSPDASTLLVAGSFGLRRSTDAGASFGDTRNDLLHGIRATGDSRTELNLIGPQTLLRTSDGGASFTVLNRPPGKLADVSFVTSRIGFAVTTDARVWRTDDRGGRWRELYGVGAYRLVGLGSYIVNAVMSFRRNPDGSIAGSLLMKHFGGAGLGWVLHTSDGGATWRPQLVDDQPAVGIVRYRGHARLNLVTNQNRIFLTTTGGDSGKQSSIALTATAVPNGRVRVDGALAPQVPRARVVLFARELSAKTWQSTVLRADSKGRFTDTVPRRHGWRFVAQWEGDAIHRGAGSKALVWP